MPKKLKLDVLKRFALYLHKTYAKAVYLVHSEKSNQPGASPSTEPYARFIQRVLCRNRRDLSGDNQVILLGIHATNRSAITTQTNKILNKIPENTLIGLNYTGGTKPMAAHVYRAVAAERPEAVFSYLDADSLSLWVDSLMTPIPCKLEVKICLADIANLHGYELGSIQHLPRLIDLSVALKTLHSTDAGIQLWREWLYKLSQTGKDAVPLLPDASDPLLKPVCLEFDCLCGGPATASGIAEVISGKQDLKPCDKWLRSGWLEELTLQAVQACAEQCGFHDFGGNIKPSPAKWARQASTNGSCKNFELDVAAVRGYQLFVFSCIASRKAGDETKKHLLEAYVRAKQLGGDEARIGLVCLSTTPQALQDDIERDWLTTRDHVKVFGINELDNLSENIIDWLKKC